MWEQRYSIISPKRSDTNIRYYTDEDLKLLLNISVLNCHGYKISEIAQLKCEEINEAVLKLSTQQNEFSGCIKSLTCAMLRFDEHEFNTLFNTTVIQHGLEQAMIKVVFPLLNEIGILWQVGSITPAHEHFVTHIIKQKLYVAIDGNLGRYVDGRKKFLLFLPEGEQHSIGLLFANYVIRSRGHCVTYLGQEVPVNALKENFKNQPFDYIFTLSTAARSSDELQQLVVSLSTQWPNAHVLVSGYGFLTADLNFPPNASLVKRPEEFVCIVNSLIPESVA